MKLEPLSHIMLNSDYWDVYFNPDTNNFFELLVINAIIQYKIEILDEATERYAEWRGSILGGMLMGISSCCT